MASVEERVARLQEDIRLRHLQQLEKIPVSTEKRVSNNSPWRLPSYYQYMEKWSLKAKDHIHAAIDARATSDKDLSWDVGLYAFMESAAVYLRDWPTLFLASQAARQGQSKEALELLSNSDAEIRKIASMWHPDLHYVTICDLVEEHPDSDPTLDGPFCGAFFSSNPKTPFVGIVFKGTHVESWEEMLVDLRYIPVESTGKHLWSTHVSQGVFATLFGPFPKLGGQTPFDYIQRVVSTITASNGNVSTDVHLTGHSLGASYATLCYAELLRLQLNPPTSPRPSNLRIRDLYTYGSPRVALGDFVDALSDALDPEFEYPTSKSSTSSTSSFRILTTADPVPLVPPALLTDPKFIHLDSAYRVSTNAEPEPVDSERGTHPRPPLVPVFDMSSHTPFAYFDALYWTAGSRKGKVGMRVNDEKREKQLKVGRV
ncbi:Alpha/Beta hydrolase protein [Irpex rosettiformis]|uniref:Alpha/Beta hydrolase protein n=1 Tax=Irpex rosettiformis TaxID=378272 RepID=A0ACB8UCR5_9APHY|nr:Alpha/Beta hydrolase protein [Irpex rosettiformis]